MEDRDRIIKRVNALIERAVHDSTPEEEARTSALIAVREIKKHGLSVGTLVRIAPPPRSASYEQNPWYDQRPPPPPEKRFIACNRCGVVRESGVPCKSCEDRDAEAERRAKQRQERETSRRQTTAREAYQSSRGGSQRYKELETRFASKCKSCGNLCSAGETVAWVRGEGVTHWDCRDYWSRA